MIYSAGHLWKIRCELFTKQEIPEEVIKDFRNLNEFIKIEDFDCIENISFGVEDKHAKKLSFICDLTIQSQKAPHTKITVKHQTNNNHKSRENHQGVRCFVNFF